MLSHSGNIGLLGKLPSHGDFIRINIQGDAWKAFDTWIQEAFYYAGEVNALQDGYIGADGYAFYFSVPGTSNALVGYLKPSQDTIGRKFPIILAASVETGMVKEEITYNPVLVYNTFVQHASELVKRATKENLGRDQLISEIETLVQHGHPKSTIDEDFSPGGISWKELSEESGLSFDDSQKYLPFKNLSEIVVPLRSGIPAHYTLGFRFPGGSSATLRVYSASFWLAAFQKALGQPMSDQCLFWRIGEADSKGSSLLAFLQPPPAKILVNMLPVESESDYICDMQHIGIKKKDLAAESLSAVLRQVLDSSESSLVEVLQQFG